MAQFIEAGTPVNLSASGAVSIASGSLIGFYVNSTSSGTIVISNGTAASKTDLSGTITPAIGFHRFPAYCPAGCYVTIASTLNVTLFYAAG